MYNTQQDAYSEEWSCCLSTGKEVLVSLVSTFVTNTNDSRPSADTRASIPGWMKPELKQSTHEPNALVKN
jgi:hypothetical protein